MIALVNTTQDNRESVLFQHVLKAYPTHHPLMITAHVSLGNMEKQWRLFTKQMIRTHQLLPSLIWNPAAPTELLSGLDEEFSDLNSIYTSYQPLIQAATQLLQREPSFDGIPVSSKHMKRHSVGSLTQPLQKMSMLSSQELTSCFPHNRTSKRPLFMCYHYSMSLDKPPR